MFNRILLDIFGSNEYNFYQESAYHLHTIRIQSDELEIMNRNETYIPIIISIEQLIQDFFPQLCMIMKQTTSNQHEASKWYMIVTNF